MATTSNGTTTSFGNTPQATDDYLTAAITGLTEDTTGIVYLDVLANDLGGAAKTLFSIDNGISAGGTRPTDLLTQDTGRAEATSTDTSLNGAKIWITSDGKIGYDVNTLSATFKDQLQHLNAGEYLTDSFTYSIRLGNGTLSWATATVQIAGTNDIATITGASSASVTEAGGDHNSQPGTPSIAGTLTAHDMDNGQSAFQAPAASALVGSYGTFNFNATSGAWTYTLDQSKADALTAGQHATETLTVKSLDGTATQTITVDVVGSNDTASIGGTLAGAVVEAGGANNADTHASSASGTLTVSDVDTGEAVFQAPAAAALNGAYGTFTFNAGTGAWTYTLDQSKADALPGGQHASDTLTVKSADGTATQVITVDIAGSNDNASISGSYTSAVVEAGGVANADLHTPTTNGQLTVSDVDNGEAAFQTVDASALVGTYGTFTFNASSGAWTYALDQAKADVLADGQPATDTLTVKSLDGTATQVITVNITGTNDAAELSSATANLTETNSAADISTSGTLTIHDVDSPSTFVAQTDADGSYGKFSIDAGGNWTYTADSAHNEFQAGTTYTDSFQVASADGTPTSVTIKIAGTNDAATLSSAAVALDETNAPLTTGGTLTISDVDSPETFVAQNNISGNHGTFSIDTSGNWSYTANSAFDNLNVGNSVSDTFTVSSADGTLTSVQVTINGTNDAAVLSSAAIALDETNAPLTTGGTLTISDVDSPETFVAQSNAHGNYGTFNIDANGAWSYTADSAFDGLNVGNSVSDTFTVASADGTLTSVQVTINGTNDAAVLSSAVVALDETNAPLTTGGTLTISDVDSPETFVAQSNADGNYGTFSIDANGAWSYTANSAFDSLNVGDSVSDTFTVASADGTQTSVQVTINGTNDAAVLSSAAIALDETNVALTTGGSLTISDVDSPETFVAQSNVGGNYGTFNIDASGAWTYTANSAFDSLNVGNSVSDTFTVASADGTLTSVQVTINGTNDAAVLSSAVVALNETNAALTTGGTLTISDVDSPQTFVAQSNVHGAHGTFSIDTAGAWTYTADSAFDGLNVGGSVSDTFSVASADGTLTSVQVTINGTNDPAVLGSASVALNETNAALTTGGQLSISDVDNPAAFVVQNNTAGAHGSFSVAADGTWSYTANSAFDSLNVGGSVSDTFSVAAADGTLTSVQVTINGTNDAALITGTSSGTVTEAGSANSGGTPTATGDLLATDVDNTNDLFQAVTVATATTYGTYTVSSTGIWTYILDNNNATVNALNSNSSPLSDSFTVYSQDGTAKTVNISINGADDVVNHAPTDISLNISNVPGGNTLPSAGTTLGSFSTTDPDGDTAFTYSLQSGSSSGFSISTGGTLTNTAALAESTTYTLNVQSKDAGGLTYQETFNIITGSNSGNDNPLVSSSNAILNGDDVLYGSGGNDVIFGGSGNDTIFGQNGTDKIYGGAGNDILNGGNQSDTYVFLASDGGGTDTITNFVASGGNSDVLDISDLLTGYTQANASQFIHLTESNGNTIVSVDRDGSGSTYSSQDVAVLQGVTGLSLNTLLTNGTIDTTP